MLERSMANTFAGIKSRQPAVSSTCGKREHTLVTDKRQETLECSLFQLILTAQGLDKDALKGRHA